MIKINFFVIGGIHSMNSKQIECFFTVSKYLNFTEAGEKLYTSQSNISRNISLLEEELNMKLFYRGNNYVRLTPAGAVMLSAFQQIEEFLEEQKKLAFYTNNGESGSLTIGFITFMSLEKFFINIIDKFKQEYPKIIVNYVILDDNENINDSSLNNIDLIFTHEFDHPNSKNYLSKNICYTEMFLMYGKMHKLYGKNNLSPSDFENDIVWTSKSANTNNRETVVNKIMKFYKVKNYKSESASNFDTALLNIALGNGIAFLDSITLPVVSDSFATLKIDSNVSKLGIDVTWRKSNLNPAIPLFVKAILIEE